jgi:hypothetical protein
LQPGQSFGIITTAPSSSSSNHNETQGANMESIFSNQRTNRGGNIPPILGIEYTEADISALLYLEVNNNRGLRALNGTVAIPIFDEYFLKNCL